MNTKLNHIQNWLERATQANWSVKVLAEHLGVSVRGLELHFRKKMRMTPKKWLAEQRLRRAIEMLDAGALVKETAAELSYKHASHFSRDFRKHWGNCPKEFMAIKLQKLPGSV